MATAVSDFLTQVAPASDPGFARSPGLHGDLLVFGADGDLFVRSPDGAGSRLASGLDRKGRLAISRCGRWVAYSRSHRGFSEAYVMPTDGGPSKRVTFDGLEARVCGWHADGRLLYATQARAALSRWSLTLVNTESLEVERLPLADASDGCFDDADALIFVRNGLLVDHVRNYRGGAMAQLWKVDLSTQTEAAPFFLDEGVSGAGTWFPRSVGGRLYFLSELDGQANVWSAKADGSDLCQHTAEREFGVQDFSVFAQSLVYSVAGRLYLKNLKTGRVDESQLRLRCPFDHLKERRIEHPMRYFTAAATDTAGNRVLLHSRGKLFVVEKGVDEPLGLALPHGSRAGAAAFSADGLSVFAVCDASGEEEIWRLSLNGASERLTFDGNCQRTGLWPSPDGRWLAHADVERRLWLHDLEGANHRMLIDSPVGGIQSLVWRRDVPGFVVCRAVEHPDRTQLEHWLIGPSGDESVMLTSARYASYSPCISADGGWLFFLSEREFNAQGHEPWGDRNFGVGFEKRVRCDAIALQDNVKWPFGPVTEPDTQRGSPRPNARWQRRGAPVPAGNYRSVVAGAFGLLLWECDPGVEPAAGPLLRLPLGSSTLAAIDARKYGYVQHSQGQSRPLVRWAGKDALLQWLSISDTSNVSNSAEKPGLQPVLDQQWSMRVRPTSEWRHLFADAWRYARGRMYDRDLHGVDWTAIGRRYGELMGRVSERQDVSDVIGQMYAELGTLHTYVREGEHGDTDVEAQPAFLGVDLEAANGEVVVRRVLDADPEQIESLPPAAAPDLALRRGDCLESLSGLPLKATAPGEQHQGMLLMGLTGRRVWMTVRNEDGERHQVPAVPVSAQRDQDLRYGDWVASRRTLVRRIAGDSIGYVHLRAMKRPDLESFVRDFYESQRWQGLVIDVRANRGGNIDSWVIEKLRREAWAYWTRPRGEPAWNMQGALRAHLAVLIDQQTYSAGETFAMAVRHFELGPLIGMRTSGAGIWMTQLPNLADGATVTVGEFGQFKEDGTWMIEGHGIEPDVVVDNAPRATFDGRDNQLETAVRMLQERIGEKPMTLPTPRAAPRLGWADSRRQDAQAPSDASTQRKNRR